MTQEEKEKLRNILYNKKCIADYRDEDPFVGIYFSDLIDLLEDYKRLAETEWFQKHYNDKSLGEIIQFFNDIIENQKDIPGEFANLVNEHFWDLIDDKQN